MSYSYAILFYALCSFLYLDLSDCHWNIQSLLFFSIFDIYVGLQFYLIFIKCFTLYHSSMFSFNILVPG